MCVVNFCNPGLDLAEITVKATVKRQLRITVKATVKATAKATVKVTVKVTVNRESLQQLDYKITRMRKCQFGNQSI